MKVEFFTESDEFVMEDIIVPMKQIKNPWASSAAKHGKESGNKHQTHICDGIRLLNTSGWAVCAWSDIRLTDFNKEEGSMRVHFPSNDAQKTFDKKHGEPAFGFFEPYQFTQFAKTLAGTFPVIFKVPCPFHAKVPKGWGLMYTPLLYHNQNQFYSATGILDPRFISQLNAILFLHPDKNDMFIKKGTPLFQITPVPLETPSHEIRMATKQESKWIAMGHHLTYTRFQKVKKQFTDMFGRIFNE